MPWHDLPESYGPYTIAHNRFIRWSRRGIWKWNFDAAGRYRRQTYDCEKVRQQIKDEGALPVIPAAAMSPIKPTVRSASTAAAIQKLLLPHKDWRRIATRYDELARVAFVKVSGNSPAALAMRL
jgi:transposase